MHLTRDELNDKIFELEIDTKELQAVYEGGKIYLQNESDWPDYQKEVLKMVEENACWIAYYKDLLQELEQGE